MKKFKTWWMRQFDSPSQMKLFTYPTIVLVVLSIILEILTQIGIDTVIF